MRITRAIMILLLCALLSLSGCNSQHEINTLAIVMGVGIDDVEGTHQHKITTQVAKASSLKASSGEGGADQSDSAYINAQYESDGLFPAIQSMGRFTSRDLYFSHNQIILAGRAVAERDIGGLLDFFTRDYEGRLNTAFAVADGRAEDFLKEETQIEKLPAVHLRNLLDAQVTMSASAPSTLREFLIATLSKTTAPVAPLIELFKDQEDKTKARIGGTAVFKGGRMIGSIDNSDTRALLWVAGRMERGSLEVSALGGNLSFDLLESTSRVSPILRDGRFSIEITIDQVLRIAEARNVEGLMKVESVDVLDAHASQAIERAVRSAIEHAQSLNADVFGFGEMIRRHHPIKSRALIAAWDEEFPNLVVDVRVNASVRSTGSATAPIAPGGSS